ncbi:UDP-N-acetylenolpyruvoylglucosamine reductase [Candidatus Palibaumannia cicadellinicola]|uniref:UDP-N-acetylenolpyruvoylglucosamine reductase n=1 Tax=Candidatus Palibaumannia cicadellinicola TaxID=186490 RepID=A0A2N4XV83_9GAMM|nr:UDP-N-acetylmuramate dehydrogenase [Candidatus Baumannia cicadellinicola]PLK57793.1 UDP-N-acetylenolpyruvoylglucosamine reductase [Candidatus Baumannia cicadellinicola]
MTLKPLNTFSLNVYAHQVVTAHSENQLLMLWKHALQINRPALLLGSGSNVLFLENYTGTVLLNRIKGIVIREDAEAWYLHVGAGEVWHDLVIYTLERKIPGLENLALIPGYIGSAPIQNIGAYGVALQDLCEYVDIIQLDHGTKLRLNALECQFGYRDSIFKHRYRENVAIVAVGLRLSKFWRPVLNYGNLKQLDTHNVTPRQIFDTICAMRRNKLPNSKTGNAGSFFKNPLIDTKTAAQLLACYPDAPYSPQTNGGIKLAAGWLIDRCKLKGYQVGHAAVYEKQALILINIGQASGLEIATLAKYVRYIVADKFAIWLEPEVRFIGAEGEVDAIGALL